MKQKDPQVLKMIQKKAMQSNSKFRIAAFGFNKKGECVLKSRNGFRFNRKGGGIHAEMKIMQEANKKGIKTILICRVGRSGELRPIEPCETCQKKANELDIKIISIGERNEILGYI
jgi:cytidine deaminase